MEDENLREKTEEMRSIPDLQRRVSFSVFQSGGGRLKFRGKDLALCSGRKDESFSQLQFQGLSLVLRSQTLASESLVMQDKVFPRSRGFEQLGRFLLHCLSKQ